LLINIDEARSGSQPWYHSNSGLIYTNPLANVQKNYTRVR